MRTDRAVEHGRSYLNAIALTGLATRQELKLTMAESYSQAYAGCRFAKLLIGIPASVDRRFMGVVPLLQSVSGTCGFRSPSHPP
jgi:hypothetical protein